MPATMKKLLDDWWTSHQQDISPHEPIPGGYTNVDKVPMNRLNLDRFPEIRNGLVKEMQQVLQWWYVSITLPPQIVFVLCKHGMKCVHAKKGVERQSCWLNM